MPRGEQLLKKMLQVACCRSQHAATCFQAQTKTLGDIGSMKNISSVSSVAHHEDALRKCMRMMLYL